MHVCVCVCETVQSKENSRVFSLEFAHTAHRLRRDYLLTNRVHLSLRWYLSSPTRNPSPCRLLVFIITITHACQLTPTHKHSRTQTYTRGAHNRGPKRAFSDMFSWTNTCVSRTSQGHLLQFRHVYDARPVKRALFKAIYTPQMGPATALS